MSLLDEKWDWWLAVPLAVQHDYHVHDDRLIADHGRTIRSCHIATPFIDEAIPICDGVVFSKLHYQCTAFPTIVYCIKTLTATTEWKACSYYLADGTVHMASLSLVLINIQYDSIPNESSWKREIVEVNHCGFPNKILAGYAFGLFWCPPFLARRSFQVGLNPK